MAQSMGCRVSVQILAPLLPALFLNQLCKMDSLGGPGGSAGEWPSVLPLLPAGGQRTRLGAFQLHLTCTNLPGLCLAGSGSLPTSFCSLVGSPQGS